MSRSEHATRRDRRDPGDLARKRRVKELILAERQRPRVALPPVSGDAVPIEVVDHGRFTHYAASAADLRQVIDRLPPGCVDGLSRIDLRLGPPDDPDADDKRAMDPFLGRFRHELMPGVFSGRVLGCYSSDAALVQLHAYVYDPAVPDRVIVELYLRLKMLATFVHGLGHHHDFSRRVARGRWRADDDEEAEIHAEAIEHAWTRDYVAPYLEDAYPAEVDELRRWLEQHGGVSLPLELLVGDPRTTRGVGGESLFFTVGAAFEELRATATTRYRARIVDVVACLLHLRQQRFAEVYTLTTRILAEPCPHPDVRAAHIEAACQLGHPFDATPLPELCASLARRGYAAWATRLTTLAASRATTSFNLRRDRANQDHVILRAGGHLELRWRSRSSLFGLRIATGPDGSAQGYFTSSAKSSRAP